ncbi:carboxylesterase/lipase family protein [Novosphingobium terrae]|uniref:carboxylesterase/lipase family protein n=1 Tax=Novosphingobium terrae TaxID=2726189 RepID=UPI00198130C1|nr:carboxylesterase family protein [Novosphingobium terrae]
MIDRRGTLALLGAAPLFSAAPTLATPARADPQALTIATTLGRVQGAAQGDIRLFTGIPFGRAARFAAPRPAPRWQGVLAATEPAHVAPQSANPSMTGTMSEDCLQLNIWAPSTPGPHPVLVYIHGGGNEGGWSGEAPTAGDRFARDGVVCVTVNYRLGALGFLETGALLGPAYRGSGNNGLRDQLLALRWVQANIAAFGGDPRRVTIAGESAGGKNVGSLMGLPAADGLYAQAAMFSGGGETVHTMAEAEAFARVYAEKLGGQNRLLTASMAEILAAQHQARTSWPRNFPFRPVVDGALMPMVPLERMRSGKAPGVPLLIGSNADEGRMFLPADRADQPLSPQAISNAAMAQIADLDRGYAQAFPDLSAAQRHWRLLTAEEYGMPCLRIALAHAGRGASVFRYRLTYPAPGGPFKGYTPHVLDVPFTFDHVTVPAFARFFGTSAADQPMADRMHAAMVSFVAQGRPVAAGLPDWGRFDTAGRATMVLDHQSALVADPDRAERLLWGL